MANTATVVATALKKATKYKSDNALTKKLAQSGLYRQDGTEIKVKDTAPKYKDYDVRSDATLVSEAKSYAEDAYRSKVADANAKADKKINDLNKKLLTEELKKNNEEAKLDGEYYSETKQITDKAARNGIINSSIYESMMDDAQKDYDRQKTYLSESYGIKSEAIKNEMSIVEEQRKSALMEYDLKKAEEFEKRLAALRKAQYENNEKIREYNAKLREFEKNYEENKKRTLEEWQKAIDAGIA